MPPDPQEPPDFVTPTRVGGSFGMKINTGNYTSVDFALWETRDVPDGMDPSDERLALMEELKTQARLIASSIKTANPTGKPKIP